jgi:hypothetical protein
MKLTVGPLPPAVYWRRRAIVLGVLLVAMILLWSSCSNSSSGSDRASPNPSRSSPSPSPSTTLLSPTVPSASSSPEPTTSPTSSPAPVAAPAPAACTDADLVLTATPETAVAPSGAYIKFTLKVKNISARPCVRDLGADHQELYLQAGTSKVWSSDVCDAPHGSELVTMQPNIERSYANTWNGKASDKGCANRAAPPPGKYELFARLDTKISDPSPVQLT